MSESKTKFDVQPVITKKEQFIEDRKKTPERISTGFKSIDIMLNGGLQNELYIMAAETSTGKSAFMMSMAQNMAATKKINVLYFTIEMSADEFIARGISYLSYCEYRDSINKRKENVSKCYSASDILYWRYNLQLHNFEHIKYEDYSQYSEKYFEKYGENLYIIEGGMNGMTVQDIAAISTTFKKEHEDKNTVVFVDYMQLVKVRKDNNSQTDSDRKSRIDDVCRVLKSLASQDGKMPVFTVSSVSRKNYNDKIDTASFKESGDIEYTGGILIGWNWCGVTDCKKSKKEKEEKLSNERGYRKMDFDLMKSRNSQRNTSVHLVYRPKYNHFMDEYTEPRVKNLDDDIFKNWYDYKRDDNDDSDNDPDASVESELLG